MIGLADTILINDLCHHLAIHELVVEDVLNIEQRIKLDRYQDYFFIVLKTRAQGDAQGNMKFEQLSFITKNNMIISFHETANSLLDPLFARLTNKYDYFLDSEIGYLCYAIIDLVIDQYFELIESKS